MFLARTFAPVQYRPQQCNNYNMNVTYKCLRVTLLLWKSNKYYIFWMCVCVALGIQHAMCVRLIVICGLSGARHYFSTIPQKTKNKKKKKSTQMCCDFLHNFSPKHLIFCEEMSEVSLTYIALHIMYPLFFSDFNET
jgi:hypothetical protein